MQSKLSLLKCPSKVQISKSFLQERGIFSRISVSQSKVLDFKVIISRNKKSYSSTPDSVVVEQAPTLQQTEIPAQPAKSTKVVAIWLFICAGLVFIMVVVGGVTRLTGSGLSITDWRPVTGTIPPLTEEEWEFEFEKYKKTPEFVRVNPDISMAHFKQIFYMEWAHRFLGRAIGVVFGVPFLIFLSRGYLTPPMKKKLAILFGMGGMQGFIGWWMVKSGVEVDQEHPRVSPYRLATHLGSAFVIYLGLLWTAMSLYHPTIKIPSVPIPKTIKMGVHFAAMFTFVTAMSGAFVAGLDAGLLYPEIPYMGQTLMPQEYWEMEPWYKNFFENGSSVQFNHRLLATTTYTFISALFFYSRSTNLVPHVRRAMNHVYIMANCQVLLGIATLLYYVPTPVAATHQAGSLLLLTLILRLMHVMKRIH